MKNKIVRLIIFSLLITEAFFQIGGCHNSNGSGWGNVNVIENEFTPIIASFVTKPRPFSGSDDKHHLTYELQLTNATSFNWIINSLSILNAKNHGQVFKTFSGDNVMPNNHIIPGRIPSQVLNGGETSVFFITFSVDSIDDIPEKLAHRLKITIPGGIPEGFLSFLSLPHDTQELDQILAEGYISEENTVVMGPPLRGDKWVVADGCCTAERHVRAVMPVNGKLVISQRYAIDWEKLNDEDRIFVGDPQDVNSYFCYGEEILAVSEGRVVAAVDKYDDQVPGEFPVGIPFDEADGNYVVIDLDNGNYAFYAHMIKGSLAVEVGDFVTRGQVIGLVGNTGNTIAPHLHFHMMSGPSTFGSDGVPYMIYEYELVSRAASTEAFDKAEAEGTPLEIVPVNNPGIRKDDLPLDLSIVNFAE